MSTPPPRARLGHGDHWLAALAQDDPRLASVLAAPMDAAEGLALHRSELTSALDMVQVTARRRLVSAYPEPRATALLHVTPVELNLWETQVEGWLTAEHEGAGHLTFFLTDLPQRSRAYQRAGRRAGLDLEAGALAYTMQRVLEPQAPRLLPASRIDARFLPDDYSFEGRVLDVTTTDEEQVLLLEFQGGLQLPVARRGAEPLAVGDHVQGVLWLTGRLPTAETEK